MKKLSAGRRQACTKTANNRKRQGRQVILQTFSCPSSVLMVPRYIQLHKRTGRAQSVEIKESIRAIYETSHVLAEQVGSTSWDEEQDNSRSLSSTRTPKPWEMRYSLMNTQAYVFICPLCGKDFVHIVELEKSNYTIGAV